MQIAEIKKKKLSTTKCQQGMKVKANHRFFSWPLSWKHVWFLKNSI